MLNKYCAVSEQNWSCSELVLFLYFEWRRSGPQPSSGGFASLRQPHAWLPAEVPPPRFSRRQAAGSGVLGRGLAEARVSQRQAAVLTAWAPRTLSGRAPDLVVGRHANPLRAPATDSKSGPEPVLSRQW